MVGRRRGKRYKNVHPVYAIRKDKTFSRCNRPKDWNYTIAKHGPETK